MFDAGPSLDAGIDAGPATDAGSSDAGVDGGSAQPDAGMDAGLAIDAGPLDAGSGSDAGLPPVDAGPMEQRDAGAVDAGLPVLNGDYTVGCGCTSAGPIAMILGLLAALKRRR